MIEISLRTWCKSANTSCSRIEGVITLSNDFLVKNLNEFFQELLDPEKGFIKDDIVILRAHVIAEMPLIVIRAPVNAQMSESAQYVYNFKISIILRLDETHIISYTCKRTQ